MKTGDSIKDVKVFLTFRKKCLLLHRQQVPFIQKDTSRIEKEIKGLTGRIREIDYTLKILEGDIKGASKYWYAKWEHLYAKKAEILRGTQ